MGFRITCTHRGEDRAFELHDDIPTLLQLGQHLATTTGVELSTLKLIVPKRKPIVPVDAPATTVAEAGAPSGRLLVGTPSLEALAAAAGASRTFASSPPIDQLHLLQASRPAPGRCCWAAPPRSWRASGGGPAAAP
jgi:hypothetical protein